MFLQEPHGVRSQKTSFFIICAKHNYNYKIEEDEVGGTCGTNEREEERV
jgi:hypothetical protein